MPRLWTATIEAHRHAVRDAILQTTAELVAEHGLRTVTMSQIAEQVGIGRATLYKYFPDIEAILVGWHDQQIAGHLERLQEIRAQAGEPGERLAAVLEAYAIIQHEVASRHQAGALAHGQELAVELHRGEHAVRAHAHLSHLIDGLLADAAAAGAVRDDVPTRELARYCINALTAASDLSSKAAVRRLVAVTLSGLRPL